jgi:hypothetical protein
MKAILLILIQVIQQAMFIQAMFISSAVYYGTPRQKLNRTCQRPDWQGKTSTACTAQNAASAGEPGRCFQRQLLAGKHWISASTNADSIVIRICYNSEVIS